MPKPTKIRGAYGKAIEEFIESGETCIGKRYGSKEDAYRAYSNFKNALAAHSMPAKASKSGLYVYLIRETEENDD